MPYLFCAAISKNKSTVSSAINESIFKKKEQTDFFLFCWKFPQKKIKELYWTQAYKMLYLKKHAGKPSCQLIYLSLLVKYCYHTPSEKEYMKPALLWTVKNLLTRKWEWKHPGLNNVNIIKHPGKYNKLKRITSKYQKAYTLSNNKSNTWHSSPWKVKLDKLLQEAFKNSQSVY